MIEKGDVGGREVKKRTEEENCRREGRREEESERREGKMRRRKMEKGEVGYRTRIDPSGQSALRIWNCMTYVII